MDNESLAQFKINLRNKILNLYTTFGYQHAVNSVNHLIKNSNKKSKAIGEKDLPVNIRGECCEILLELQILEYTKTKNMPWILSKGLTFNRKDGSKRFKTTELDLTLFTPSRIVLFESKYRMGKIKLIDECTIVPAFGHQTDVYHQNLMHLDNLRYYLNPAVIDLKRGKPFSIALYVDEVSRVTDCREDKYKGLIPCVGSENIELYLNKLSTLNNQVWDIKIIERIIKKMDAESDDLFLTHLRGVRK